MVWSHPRTGPLSSVDPLPNNFNRSNLANPVNPEVNPSNPVNPEVNPVNPEVNPVNPSNPVNPEVNPSPDFVNTKGSVSHPSSLAAG